jgi:hypothetical protein
MKVRTSFKAYQDETTIRVMSGGVKIALILTFLERDKLPKAVSSSLDLASQLRASRAPREVLRQKAFQQAVTHHSCMLHLWSMRAHIW